MDNLWRNVVQPGAMRGYSKLASGNGQVMPGEAAIEDVAGGGLSLRQWEYLARRLFTDTDDEAAMDISLDPARIVDWQRDNPAFRVALREIRLPHSAPAIAREISRIHLGLAALRLGEELSATKLARDGTREPDWHARHRALELIHGQHGLGAIQRVEHTGNPDRPLQMAVRLESLTTEELLLLHEITTREPQMMIEPAKEEPLGEEDL